MEMTTIIGAVGGFAVIIIGMIVMGADLTIYWDPASVFITLGGTVAATLVGNPSSNLRRMSKIIKVVLKKKEVDPVATIETLITFAEKARREGILSLEDDVEDISDPFLAKAIQLVVDGTDPEVVKKVMMTEIENMEVRHAEGKKIFDDMGYYAPAFGMIGTLIGLIMMLANIEDKSSIGTGMATALITTLYGAILANLLFIPTANKLELLNNVDVLIKEIMIEGVLSIQAGENPMVIREKLTSFLTPQLRAEMKEREKRASEV